MKELSLADNQLSGNISYYGNWTVLPYLKHINISRNSFTGSLPPEWSALRNNVTIDVSYNNLTGPLPATWSSMGADGQTLPLTYLDASYNSLTGDDSRGADNDPDIVTISTVMGLSQLLCCEFDQHRV